MAGKGDPPTSKILPADPDIAREVLGYLNFSNGKPDTGFQRNFNHLHKSMGIDVTHEHLRGVLFDHLRRLERDATAFAECGQAEAIIGLVFDGCLPAYCSHHADLLHHLEDADFRQPFLIARFFEATLSQGPPWDETQRIVDGALDQLNDFLGYRPLALLENERQREPYAHERFRPVPIYIRDVGVATGRYEALVTRTIEFLRDTPDSILGDAHFSLSCMDELAIDVRAHDHLHPANKRTNYMFGEWDPHLIGSKGYYRRFVIRQIILDLLLKWMTTQDNYSADESLNDAASVLCGTMLMASSISGWGPGTFDSSVTLTSLLPKVARQRDAFYSRLFDNARGDRKKRLEKEAELTRQPFGHVRQFLNIELSKYGARQVQCRHLALIYARMGDARSARLQAGIIPAASMRIECEMAWRLQASDLELERGHLSEAQALIGEVEDLLERAIACGAMADPWNIIGFQGHFPLFTSQEDAIPDQRIESLYAVMDRLFSVYAHALGEASAAGRTDDRKKIGDGFRKLAEHWDQYAPTIIEDLPEVSGQESWESADQVADVLSQWRDAGQASGDISFWKKQVDRFESPKAYARVVGTLLDKRDHVAAMGLLIEWISRADDVGLEAGEASIHTLLVRWMGLVTETAEDPAGQQTAWKTVRRMFDYLDANAGSYRYVPRLAEALGAVSSNGDNRNSDELDDPLPPDFFSDEVDEDADSLFAAAYEHVVYRDSADDGTMGDMLGGDNYLMGNSEFESMTRYLEPRLRFLNTLAQLWQMAAAAFVSQSKSNMPKDGDDSDAIDKQAEGTTQIPSRDEPEQQSKTLLGWYQSAVSLQDKLLRLMAEVWRHDISTSQGDHDSNIEFDFQIQTKFYLLHIIIATHVSCQSARRCLLCCMPENVADVKESETQQQIIKVYRAIFARDATRVRRALPKLLDRLSKSSLLYVALENGGHPEQVRASRSLQTVIQFLLTQLPRLGLLRETWHVLKTAHDMERASFPAGQAVTEFDRLFDTALKNTLECVTASSSTWKSGRFSDDELVKVVLDIVEQYLDLWLTHSKTMRLSFVEELHDPETWEHVKQFVIDYGADLFHARSLTLGNVRTILHTGIEAYLEHLASDRDPLHPIRLIDDLDSGDVDRDHATNLLELIYRTVVDKFDRFLEYNTTTTQSDYGEKFYCLLDFLQQEAKYERDDWKLAPFDIAHEILSRSGRLQAAKTWETLLQVRTAESAELHVIELAQLERKHGMRLPSLSDHINERFVKPMAVNRMLALVAPAIEDVRHDNIPSESLDTLQKEIDSYLENTLGSGIDIPDWLRSLEHEVHRIGIENVHYNDAGEPEIMLAQVPLGLREMRRQLKIWTDKLARSSKNTKS